MTPKKSPAFLGYSQLFLNSVNLIKNGRIQKFEYTTELAWKVSKAFIEIRLGIVSNSPKEIYRIMFQNKLINEKLFHDLLETIDDRNHVSHIYHEEAYDLIYKELPNHLKSLENLQTILNATYV
ncbi:MAG: nucleotidyltransferase [Chitinophagaceae bacterium]|nr:MAG: nucleotidyltransferase [Chitinophagaceae bacterium]